MTGVDNHRAIEAVVVDTNVYKHGRVDLDRLADLAKRLDQKSIPLWVPTQVVWEWAVHAAEDAATLTTSRIAVRRLMAAGVAIDPIPDPPWPADASPAQIAEHILGELLPAVADLDNVTVLSPKGLAAIAGLRDQVLGTGPGTTKHGVRTGAIDSALVRDAVAHTRHEHCDELVFVSDNRGDIHKTLVAMGFSDGDIRIVKSEYELFKFAIPTARPATETVTSNLSIHFSAYTATTHEPDSWAGLVTDISVDALMQDDEFGAYEGLDAITSVELNASPTLIGLREVTVDDFESGASDHVVYVSFTVLLLASLTVHGYYIDNDGILEMTTRELGQVLVSAPCAAETDHEGLVLRIHQAATAFTDSADERFSDAHDAFTWLVDLLEDLAGIRVDIDRESLDERSIPHTFVLRGLHTTVTAEVDSGDVQGGEPAEWRVHFDGPTVSCTYDPNSRVWLGHHDSFDWQAPYVMTSAAARNFPEPFSGIGAVWASLTNP